MCIEEDDVVVPAWVQRVAAIHCDRRVRLLGTPSGYPGRMDQHFDSAPLPRLTRASPLVPPPSATATAQPAGLADGAVKRPRVVMRRASLPGVTR